MNNHLPGQLFTFANRKAKLVTHLPLMEFTIKNLKGDTLAQIAPFLRKRTGETVGYSIEMDKEWFYAHTGQPRELKKIICHELGHIVVPDSHGPDFVKVARRLGAGEHIGERIGGGNCGSRQ